MRRVYKNLCRVTISTSILAANMSKNSLKNVESDNSKILYKTLLDFFLQQNCTYFLNKPRINSVSKAAGCFCVVGIEFLTDAFGMFRYIIKNRRADFLSCSYPVGIEGIKFLECKAHPFPPSKTE